MNDRGPKRHVDWLDTFDTVLIYVLAMGIFLLLVLMTVLAVSP